MGNPRPVSRTERTSGGRNLKEPIDRKALEARPGKVWDAEELEREFVVTAIIAPHVVVRRRADNVVGTLDFTNQPRFYFKFQESKGTE